MIVVVNAAAAARPTICQPIKQLNYEVLQKLPTTTGTITLATTFIPNRVCISQTLTIELPRPDSRPIRPHSYESG